MKYDNFMTRHGDKLGYGIAVTIALFLAYLIFPSFMAIALPELADQVWKPPLGVKQGVSILAGMILTGLLLVILNAVRASRATGESIIPSWLIVASCLLISVIATIIAMLIGFGIGLSAIFSLGMDTAVAVLIGFLVALVARRLPK